MGGPDVASQALPAWGIKEAKTHAPLGKGAFLNGTVGQDDYVVVPGIDGDGLVKGVYDFDRAFDDLDNIVVAVEQQATDVLPLVVSAPGAKQLLELGDRKWYGGFALINKLLKLHVEIIRQ